MTAKQNFEIRQGESFAEQITYKDSAGVAINLTGYTAKMQIRHRQSGALLHEMTHLSGITLGGAAGTIDLSIAAATTLAFPADFIGEYDLRITSGGGVATFLLGGEFAVKKAVTV